MFAINKAINKLIEMLKSDIEMFKNLEQDNIKNKLGGEFSDFI